MCRAQTLRLTSVYLRITVVDLEHIERRSREPVESMASSCSMSGKSKHA